MHGEGAMTDAERYLFDLQGYLVIRVRSPPIGSPSSTRVWTSWSTCRPTSSPPPMGVMPDRGSDRYITNIADAGEPFERLIDAPAFLPYIEEMVGSAYRLNHTYAILRYGGDWTVLHGTNAPFRAATGYRFSDGRFYSTLVKVVMGLTDQNPEDGCFAVIPGSHKANVPNPFGNDPRYVPVLQPVPARAGDVVIFTEALTHGSTVNESGVPRRTLYYAYSVEHMSIWSGYGFTFSDALKARVTEPQRKLIEEPWAS